MAKKHPKRYGKEQIEIDILAQGGVPTQNQKTLLLLAEMKTLYTNLSYKCISDHYKGTEKILSEDHKTIRKAINTLKYSLQPVINKKH
ncbi:hypothetical protein [Aestuariivivens sediminicola]|uniref:hypothetical protein n=1 Tax=Aestuariivivens sediminicola TaxID=2913560 RepID=UPI001F57DF6A|nr:hypothetical protein [Aestuariivivens sediminicola]